MHELGHLLRLQHGGDQPDTCKPNYLSIMSYAYQTKLIHTGAVDGGGTIGDVVMGQSIEQIVPPDQMPPELQRP